MAERPAEVVDLGVIGRAFAVEAARRGDLRPLLSYLKEAKLPEVIMTFIVDVLERREKLPPRRRSQLYSDQKVTIRMAFRLYGDPDFHERAAAEGIRLNKKSTIYMLAKVYEVTPKVIEEVIYPRARKPSRRGKKGCAR